jgi:hypothetical protein
LEIAMGLPSAHLPELTSDCNNCAGLCCIGLALQKGEDFAIDKASGDPCPNLGRDHKCGIHADLEEKGFTGCIAFECAGAGQRVTQMRFNGESWQDAPELVFAMIKDFHNLKPLHERMTQLKAAGDLNLPPALEEKRLRLLTRTARVWSDSETLSGDFSHFLRALKQEGF